MLIKKVGEVRVLANEADAALYKVEDYEKGHPSRELRIENCKKVLGRLEKRLARK
jgi:hypothetical protein